MPKTAENAIYKVVIENSCKPLIDWFNKSHPSAAEAALIPADKNAEKKPLHATFHFDESARVLIQSKDSETFTYLSQGEIKKGAEQFQQDTLAGATACSFSAPSEAITQELKFTVISEMPENSIDIKFPFSGKFFSLALEDFTHSLLSMTCLNMNPEISPEKLTALQKIFGKLITIESDDNKKLKQNDENLEVIKAAANAELKKDNLDSQSAPSVEINKSKPAEKSDDKKDDSKTDPATKTKTDAAVDSAITKTKEAVSDVVKEAVSQVKTAADETRTTTIKEVAQATHVASKEFIADAKTAAKEVVAESIQNARSTVVSSIKAPFIYLNEKALVVKKEIKDKAEKAMTFVKEKSIQIKNSVVATVKEQATLIQNKAVVAKEAVMTAVKNRVDYLKDLLVKKK